MRQNEIFWCTYVTACVNFYTQSILMSEDINDDFLLIEIATFVNVSIRVDGEQYPIKKWMDKMTKKQYEKITVNLPTHVMKLG